MLQPENDTRQAPHQKRLKEIDFVLKNGRFPFTIFELAKPLVLIFAANIILLVFYHLWHFPINYDYLVVSLPVITLLLVTCIYRNILNSLSFFLVSNHRNQQENIQLATQVMESHGWQVLQNGSLCFTVYPLSSGSFLGKTIWMDVYIICLDNLIYLNVRFRDNRLLLRRQGVMKEILYRELSGKKGFSQFK